MPVKAGITISLVSEAKGGPFVFSGGLVQGCRNAAATGYDGVELFVPSARAVDVRLLRRTLDEYGLELAAVGTGAGFVLQKLHLCDASDEGRRRAIDFIRGIIDLGGDFGAPAIIGSMQGSVAGGIERAKALAWLGDGLEELAQAARRHGVPILLEPLNRYETNLLNRLDQAVEVIQSLDVDNVKVLGDLFHMNIEEQSIAEALCEVNRHLGHVHFVDSNRRPAGCGHIDLSKVGYALDRIGYDGYVSAEALPYPDPSAAAKLTMQSFDRYIRIKQQ